LATPSLHFELTACITALSWWSWSSVARLVGKGFTLFQAYRFCIVAGTVRAVSGLTRPIIRTMMHHKWYAAHVVPVRRFACHCESTSVPTPGERFGACRLDASSLRLRLRLRPRLRLGSPPRYCVLARPCPYVSRILREDHGRGTPHRLGCPTRFQGEEEEGMGVLRRSPSRRRRVTPTSQKVPNLRFPFSPTPETAP
jgi:hypothetical protein